MKNLEVHRIDPRRLRELGVGERWLQDRIEEDPAILGLGDLTVLERERTQVHGGRLDFLMEDPETDVRYAIEVQLGQLDESHTIRALLYLAAERRRDPDRQHRAVLVCEDAGRYAEVLQLCADHGIPVILIELRALPLPDATGIVPIATRIVDYEEAEEAVEEEEVGDREEETRATWEKKADVEALAAFDALYALFPGSSPPRYRRPYIAFRPRGTTLWCHPRRRNPWMIVDLRVPENERTKWLEKAHDQEIQARAMSRSGFVRLKLTRANVAGSADYLRSIAAARAESDQSGR